MDKGILRNPRCLTSGGPVWKPPPSFWGKLAVGVTIADIARRAEVAPSTVSRALAGKGRIAESTRNRIMQVAQELGYIASPTVRKAVGILYSPRLRHLIGDAFYGSVLEGVEATFRTWGYRVFFSTFESHDDLSQLLSHGAHDGFIVVGGDAAPEAIRILRAAAKPVVLVDNELPDDPTPAVVTANVEGSRALTRHLLSLGHREIAYVAGPLTHISLRQRVEGFRQAMAEAGSPIDDEWIAQAPPGHFGYETGLAGFYELWTRRGLRPTAVLCSNDMVALGVLQAAHEQQLSVPQDLSVAGFDDVVPGARPLLTTAKVHCREMGVQAARLLYEGIQSAASRKAPAAAKAVDTTRPAAPEGPPPLKVVIYPELRARESTAPPRAAGHGHGR